MLKDTGERVIPEAMKPANGLLLEHLARYYFALPYGHGRILDIACGTGYGAKMMAKLRRKTVTEVIGVDINEDAVEYGRHNHFHPLLKFCTGDALDPALKERVGMFDTILSFETIEHVPDDRGFLANIYSMLKPGGTLVLSTPFGEGRGKPCGSPFHYHQLSEREFMDLFSSELKFKVTDFYYQQGVAIERYKRPGGIYPIGIAVAVKA
ncbi:class I SAM-dependent methyltransferase [Evansella sp. LMS18]|uniref:class I SAM-dependent methyltransferase n=1 Tax=Evansella sp. LMS18 TaxID=2924033 RepID=UPI0020D067B4|nr:class I SAM-dependent methyltransferase [Evansella sp. LMS18]UTR12569.1 class I SAM-dependent methyltransferase [Evansella sp. LMS18]